MKKENKFQVLRIIAVIAFIIFILMSCEKEKDPVAPQLPPQSTFKMDYSLFDAQKSMPLEPMSKYNFTASSVAVWYWSVGVALTMALPTASFVESFNHEAVYDKNGKFWTWSYNFQFLGTHKAELRGSLNSDSAVWKMSIDDFEWYSGKSALDRSGGYWKLKKSLQEDEYWLGIDWERSNDTIGEIRYTNIMPSDTMYSSYIEFGTTIDEYNRFYNLFGVDKDNLVNIQWNYPDYYGRVKASAIAGYEDWQCWDENQNDVVCE